MYICPVCELRCHGPQAESVLCSGCINFAPACLAYHDDAMCFLDPCAACELPGPFRKDLAPRVVEAGISPAGPPNGGRYNAGVAPGKPIGDQKVK